jgi:HSP20 family protein
MRSLVNYNPGSRMLFGDIDRMFNSFFNESASVKASTPRADIRENENDYVLDIELPGLSEKDVEVKVEDNLLTISSADPEEKTEEKEGYILRERRSRAFVRSFVLPKDVDRESIEAGFSNGLLSLSLGKKPETKPKTIEIKSN